MSPETALLAAADERSRRLLTVRRRVVRAIAHAAAQEQPGVVRIGRGGPRFWAWLAGPAVTARLRDGRVYVRLFIVVRAGDALGPLAARVRRSIADTVERQLGLELGEVTVLVDGVAP